MQKKAIRRIVVACGGTGGHVFPGLSTAARLKERGHEVLLALSDRSEEQSALDGWDGPVVSVGTSRRLSFLRRNVSSMLGMFPALMLCLKKIGEFRSDALLAMGSYASVAPVLAARLLNIPIILHEANAVPGRAIRALRPLAKAVAVGFPETARFFKKKRVVVTGMPLRPSSSGLPDEESIARLSDEAFTILIMGGSRGARQLNALAAEAIVLMRGFGLNVQAVHLAGSADEAFVRAKYEAGGVPCAVFGFLRAVDQAYDKSSFAVCRSGASTCAELSRAGLPALLVPYPFAVNQHQLINAQALKAAGSADLIEERELDERKLAGYLTEIMEDAARRAQMSRAASQRHIDAADSRLADLLELVAAESGAEQGSR